MLTLTERPVDFNSVHLPLIYKFTSDLYPTNSVDPIASVSTSSDDAGYTRLVVSTDLKTTGSVQELEFVSVEVNGESGIYQIYTAYSDTDITIDLAYDATNTYGDVQYFYSNYHGRFKVYTGLNASHTLNADKPIRLLTEIKSVPDATGTITININDIVKSDIQILSNDLSLSTLQNDINSFTEFYIEYAESYDYSVDGYSLSTYVGTYADDSLNFAIAVNSKLPFKNGYGGLMTQYIGSGQKFLTLFEKPILFGNNYFELSVLRQATDSANLRLRRYSNNTLLTTSTITIDSKDEGFYRIPISATGSEDKILADIYSGSSLSEVKEIEVNNQCSNQEIYLTWKNYLGAMEYWLFTAEKEYSIDVEEVKQAEKNIFIDFPNSWNGNSVLYDIERKSRESILVRSQNLTYQQVQAIKYIKTSPLVQIYGDRNVSVDSSSFMYYSESDKLYSVSFTISLTDDIASISL